MVLTRHGPEREEAWTLEQVQGDGLGSWRTLTPRHPELVSGSISPWARSKRGQTQRRCQIMPIRILTLDKGYLPIAMPALQLLFAQDRPLHVTKQLEADQSMDMVARREPRHGSATMLPQPLQQVRGHTDVQRSARPAGEDVNARLALVPHEPERGDSWTLKQVQGDEDGSVSEQPKTLVPSPPHRHPGLDPGSISPWARSPA